MTINHNLLMQDVLSLVDKKKKKASEQATTKLENYDGKHLQIHIANFMLQVSQCPCLGGCISAVFKQCHWSQNHTTTKTGHAALKYYLVYDIVQ